MRRLPSYKTLTILCLLITTAAFWMVNIWFSSGQASTPTQLDTLIYYQYAQAISDGHPYAYSAGQPASTGSTSHSYPFVLAALQLLGAQGDALPMASYLFGIVCLIASLTLLSHIEERLFPESKGLGLFLTALSGPFLFTMFGESDIVLFTPLVLGALAAGLSGRTRWLTALLVLAAWTRPEGMILAGVVFMLSLSAYIFTRKAAWTRGYLLAGLVALLSAFAVLGLNVAITGHPIFTSVLGKGYFNQHPFFVACIIFAIDIVAVLKQFLWGLASGDRNFMFFPVLGAGLFLWGLASRPWKVQQESLIEGCVWLTVLGAVVLASTGGFAGFMFDRYFGWFIPLILLYSAGGWSKIYQQLAWRNFALLILLLLFLFQAVGMIFMLGKFAENNIFIAGKVDACHDIEATLPESSRISCLGMVGLAYYLPSHTVINFFGITNTDFDTPRHYTQNFEMLKHEPEKRFDYWMMRESDTSSYWHDQVVGEKVYEELSGQIKGQPLLLFRSNWSALESSLRPALPQSLEQLKGFELVDALDVGYEPHEKGHHRELVSRFKGVRIAPRAQVKQLNGSPHMDVGDVVVGMESFDVATRPGKALRVVMRTSLSSKATTTFANGTIADQHYHMNDPLRLRIQAGGQLVNDYVLPLSADTNAFSEVVFDIPANYISGDKTRLTVAGDHISNAFWFYQ